MTIKQIAQSIAAEYGLPIHELKRKAYQDDNLYNMKLDFVEQARKNGYDNNQIADYMNYHPTTVSQLYNIATIDEPTYKWQRIAQALQQRPLTTDDFPTIGNYVKKLHEEGYNVYRTPDGVYKI